MATALLPHGYNPAVHNSMDPMDAAADIADAIYDGFDEELLDTLVHQLAQQIAHARKF